MVDTHDKHIRVRPQPHAFGAETTGISLDKPLPGPALDEVKKAWAAHAVVCCPDPPLTHAELEACTLQFGECGIDPCIVPMADHPHTLALRRDADGQAVNFGAQWHADWRFQ